MNLVDSDTCGAKGCGGDCCCCLNPDRMDASERTGCRSSSSDSDTIDDNHTITGDDKSVYVGARPRCNPHAQDHPAPDCTWQPKVPRQHGPEDVSYGTFEGLRRDILQVIKTHTDAHNIQVKYRYDDESDIIHISGPRATPQARAADGIMDASDLAQSTAEHHPYWGLLYHTSEIAETILARWNDALSEEQTEDIRWSLREMGAVLERIAAARGKPDTC